MPDFAHLPTFCLAFRKTRGPDFTCPPTFYLALKEILAPDFAHLPTFCLAFRKTKGVLHALQHSILLSERSWPLILHALLHFILLSKRPRSLILHALLHFYLALRETQASDFACPLYFPYIKLAVFLHETGCFPTKLSSSPTRNMYFPT